MDILISPSEWTPEWVAAIAGSVAAVGTIGAFTVALVLISKQAKALKVTIAALQGEIRERKKREWQEREAQARMIELRAFSGWPADADDHAVALAYTSPSGVQMGSTTTRFIVSNRSDGPITKITCASGSQPFELGISGNNGRAQNSMVAFIPRGGEARLYWLKKVTNDEVYVDFTDEAGVRWRLHHRDGLSEVTDGQ
ncbi:hypothetical protein [Nocardiopsis lucentensis]|uniref:hypothetical protein n=1 Tax=Nocardiopsis lucentensis TaxID=53441 RepID=UPI000361B406|nr:hypothetical protein [Nocardiopsis lucentensis]